MTCLFSTPKCDSLLQRSFSHSATLQTVAEAGLSIQNRLLPGFPLFAMSCLRASMTSFMRDRSLPEAVTGLVKSQVEQMRIHLFGLAFMLSSSAKLAA
jgi:hypothetical protein